MCLCSYQRFPGRKSNKGKNRPFEREIVSRTFFGLAQMQGKFYLSLCGQGCVVGEAESVLCIFVQSRKDKVCLLNLKMDIFSYTVTLVL